ncbi:hypothetical protein OIU76_028633 [Salix suchowensis]|nr:hypothetical protein OIU76_028633 [Salix suchowensis]
MKVIVVAGAREFLFEIGVQDSVLDIKRRIQQLVGVPVAAQILAVSGWELIDGLDMEDYPIVIEAQELNSPMPLFSSYCRKIQIIVKFSARQINIEVDRSDTVRSLKGKIHLFDGTPIKRMSLFFSGVELDEDFRNLSVQMFIIISFSYLIKQSHSFMQAPRSVPVEVSRQQLPFQQFQMPYLVFIQSSMPGHFHADHICQ